MGTRWGTIFKNKRNDLPVDVEYREYRVTPGPDGNVRRIVVGNDGATYYTWSHYGDTGQIPFVRLW